MRTFRHSSAGRVAATFMQPAGNSSGLLSWFQFQRRTKCKGNRSRALGLLRGLDRGRDLAFMCCFGVGFCLRKFDPNCSSAFHAIRALNLPLMLLDDAVTGTETQAGSLAHGPRRVEGIEDSFRFPHTGAVIGKFQNDFLTSRVALQREDAAPDLLECIQRIAANVQTNLKKLIWVCPHPRNIHSQVHLHFNLVCAELWLAKLYGRLCHSIYVDEHLLARDLLCETQEARNQSARSLHLLRNFC